ncbi:hypothetical protein ACFQZZ_32670 [Nocardia sp. GCM10030253]|uniref:hypothetical protein n=1 Tax=Nocardia sp. GCM10030253 TaxID=3273404 RepID=UPI003645813C
MSRTTPSRPVDVAAVFPALAPLARTVTRLHPRPGTPSPHESSVGGPLLWPASEPWPHCHGPHEADWMNTFMSPADARRTRRIHAAAYDRALNAEEREILDRIDDDVELPEDPIAMLPVAQLYVRDVPGLSPPSGADLLQVLWCPFDHDADPEAAGMPKTWMFWRSAATVTDILTDPPEPPAVQNGADYVPVPCTIDPEQVIEYPSGSDLEGELREQVNQWTMREIPGVEFGDFSDDDNPYRDLCIAPGWKVGGWINWGMTDPYPQPCRACGTPTEPFLTIATREWHPGIRHWIPYEDQHAGRTDTRYPEPSGIDIRGGYHQIIRVCPASPDHPHALLMQ